MTVSRANNVAVTCHAITGMLRHIAALIQVWLYFSTFIPSPVARTTTPTFTTMSGILSSPTLKPSEFECRYPFSYWQTELRNLQTANAETSPSDESLALALSEVDNGTQEQALDLSLSFKSKVLASCGSLYGSRPQTSYLKTILQIHQNVLKRIRTPERDRNKIPD